MKTFAIALLTLAWTGLSTGYGQKTVTSTKAFAAVTPDGKTVQVKWLIYIPRTIQYHILRRNVNQKTFTRLTTTPVQATTAVDPRASGIDQQAQQTYRQVTQTLLKKSEAKFFLQVFATRVYTDNAFAKAAGMFFADTTAIPGQTYVYAVNAVYRGKEYNWAVSLPVRAGSYRPEPAPVRLTVTQEKTHRIALNWPIRTDVMAYHVYRRRGNTGPDVRISRQPVLAIQAIGGKTPPAQYVDTDTTLRMGETYYYRVAALDPFANPGDAGSPAWLTINDMDPPAPVTAFRGRVDTHKVRLSWQPTRTRDGIGYRLFRSPSLDKPFQPVSPRLLVATDTAYTDETASEGRTYYYYLRTEDQAGNGANTLPVQVSHPDLTPPVSPMDAVAQTDTLGHVSLRWRANQEADLAGYFVYRSLTNTDDNYAQRQLDPITPSTFRDTLLRNNRNLFYYRLTAVDRAGNESKPTTLTVRLPDRRAPMAPFLQTLIAAGDSVQVFWQASVSEDVRSYHVLRASAADTRPVYTVVGRSSRPPFTDRHVPAGAYRYVVQAVDSTGNVSKPSVGQLAEIIGSAVLTAPRNVHVQVDTRSKRLIVNWNRPMQPTDFAGYRVVARDQGETFRAITPLLGDVQAILTEWEAGTDYEIAVVAISRTGQQVKSDAVKASAGN